MRRQAKGLIVATLLIGGGVPALAQQEPSVLKLDDGRKIIVSGLRRWTVAMIQDSLGKYSPGDSLQSHACAAVLRYKLGFADAAATTLRMGTGIPDLVFVDVREPQDSARVHYRAVALDTLAPRADWRVATLVMARSPRSFDAGAHAFVGRSKPAAADTAAARVADFLNARRSPADHRAALDALARSPNYRDRTVAALILLNFPDHAATWSALLDGMREVDGPARGWASQVLRAVSGRTGRVPDWQELAPGVHAMLDGTSLFLLDDLIVTLNGRPEIGPQFARPFLANGAEMLLNYAASDQPVRSAPAHALLARLRGLDLGTDVSLWREWVESLSR